MSNNDEKPYRIENLEAVLANVKPEDRESIQAEIEELFRNFDPSEPPGEPVPEVPSGTTHCPKCGTSLEVAFRNRKVADMPPFDLLICRPCDEDYVSLTAIQ